MWIYEWAGRVAQRRARGQDGDKTGTPAAARAVAQVDWTRGEDLSGEARGVRILALARRPGEPPRPSPALL